ncbi:MAG: polyprenyl synthetase family protein [Armatimonadetes bacterium]|nr:polyprenyl synthetase family protein [Armatimonadota bacterium]
MILDTYLSEKRELIDAALERYLPSAASYPEVIFQSMRYSVLNGGKRLRPSLVLASCEAVGGDCKVAMPTACALEFIHAYSLIHDDLPAMDDDDLRRGKPTNHKVFGEAMAILAGDALQTLAFETIANTEEVDAQVLLAVIRRVASAAGIGGMVVGQAADILSEGKRLDAETLDFIHRHKTGALIEVSVVAGGLLGGGSMEQVSALSSYGRSIGLAFQITDDILDIEGNEVKVGKRTGADLHKQKLTYPSLYGLAKSKELAQEAVNKAIHSLESFSERAEPLRLLARFIVERES